MGESGGLRVRPLGEPSLAGLISVSHRFQVALEEMWVSPISLSKRGDRSNEKPSLMKLQVLEKI